MKVQKKGWKDKEKSWTKRQDKETETVIKEKRKDWKDNEKITKSKKK